MSQTDYVFAMTQSTLVGFRTPETGTTRRRKATPQATEPRPLNLTLRIAEAPAVVDRAAVCSSTEAAQRIRATIGNADREAFVVLFLDPKNQLLGAELHSVGDVDSSAIYPRQVMKSALLANASALIFGHNHPSGNPEPSLCDREVTRDLVFAARCLQIKVLDHVIVGPEREIFSFADQGLIDDYDLMFNGFPR